MDFVYLKPAPEKAEYLELDKVAAAPGMIALIERGALDYKGFEDGARLSKIHVCSIFCANFNYDPAEVSALYDEIEAETKAMASVSIAKASTQTAYVAELDKVKTHLDSAKYLAGVKLSADVSTWTALKEIYPAEIVVKEVAEKL